LAIDPLRAHRELGMAGLHYPFYHLNKHPHLTTDPDNQYPDMEVYTVVDGQKWVLEDSEESHALLFLLGNAVDFGSIRCRR